MGPFESSFILIATGINNGNKIVINNTAPVRSNNLFMYLLYINIL